MKVAIFSARSYDREALTKANTDNHELVFFDITLNEQTYRLAEGFRVVCAFVNDVLNKEVLEHLSEVGVEMIAMRCSGYNNLDVDVARRLGLIVVRVPNYSPYAVAEHAVGLILALNRKIHRAHGRVREGNFELEGLTGFDLYDKTVGVIGTGKIGSVFAGIMKGFGCKIIGYDARPKQNCIDMGMQYVTLEELMHKSDIISLHCPLLPSTHYVINPSTISLMKDGVMLINTSRGELIDTKAVIDGIKTGKIGFLGLDVYEEEEDLFFEDFSAKIIFDDVFARLLTLPNVLVTGHQAFLTQEALATIAQTTLNNITNFEHGKPCEYLVTK